MSILSLKTRLAVSLITAVTEQAHRRDGTVNRRLLRLLERRVPPNPNPKSGAVVSSVDTVVDPFRDLCFRLYSPNISSASAPVVVFFHGGGFTFLSASSSVYDAVCRRFAEELSAFVVSVDYRLAPEHPYPAAYDDGFDVLKFLDENHAEVLPKNADISKCFLAGDSAGGNLAHHLAVRIGRYGFESLRLIGQISIQPFFGGEDRTDSEKRLAGRRWGMLSLHRTDWCWKSFLPAGANRDHEVVNVTGPNRIDISGLDYPDTVVIVGGADPLQDWQKRYYDWLKASGKRATLIEYPNMIHAFYVFPELPESGQLIMQVKEFMSERLSATQP